MRTTITLNDTIFKALKMLSVETDKTMSELVEDAVKYQILEDLKDIKDVESRAKEPTYAFDELVKKLKTEGLL